MLVTKWIKNNLFISAAILTGALAVGITNPVQAQEQRMVVPGYFYPGPIWDKLEAASSQVKLTIMNPNSGPNTAPDPIYAKQVADAQAHNVSVIGYVDTAYGKRPVTTVEAEASKYFQWYHVNGIFFDEVASGADELPYYRQLHDYVRTLANKTVIVLNPGTSVDEGYMQVGDIICTWETGYDDYVNKFQSHSWVEKYPASRFWHIVYEVPTVSDMQAVVELSKQRHAGWVYVTPFGANHSNPYADLPAEPYWSDELAALKAH